MQEDEDLPELSPLREVYRVFDVSEVPRVLFLGIYPIFYYFPKLILFPKLGFNLNRGAVSQALIQSCLVPP